MRNWLKLLWRGMFDRHELRAERVAIIERVIKESPDQEASGLELWKVLCKSKLGMTRVNFYFLMSILEDAGLVSRRYCVVRVGDYYATECRFKVVEKQH